TSYAQLIADTLGVPPERVRMVQGDTDQIAAGAGTGGASSLTRGGAAPFGAAGELGANPQTPPPPPLAANPREPRTGRGRGGSAGWGWRARTAPFPLPTGRNAPTRPPTSSTRPTPLPRRLRPIRTAPTSPRSRSIRRPGRRASSITWWSMTSG